MKTLLASLAALGMVLSSSVAGAADRGHDFGQHGDHGGFHGNVFPRDNDRRDNDHRGFPFIVPFPVPLYDRCNDVNHHEYWSEQWHRWYYYDPCNTHYYWEDGEFWY